MEVRKQPSTFRRFIETPLTKGGKFDRLPGAV